MMGHVRRSSAWRIAVTGGMVLILGGCEGPGAGQSEVHEDVAGYLGQRGYASIPMVRLPTGHFAIRGTASAVTLDLIVDTGSSHTLLDIERARRFQLSTEDRGSRATGLGVSSQPVESGQLRDVEIGPLRIPQLAVTVLDLSQLNGVLRSIGEESVDGVIGADVLVSQSAIIDYGSLTLYLRD